MIKLYALCTSCRAQKLFYLCLLSFVMTTVITGCNGEMPEEIQDEDTELTLKLMFNNLLSGISGSNDAIVGSLSLADREETVDINDLWIGFFDEEGNLWKSFYYGAGNSDVEMTFSGNGIFMNFGNNRFPEKTRMVVLSGWSKYGVSIGNYSGNSIYSVSSLDDLRNIRFSYPPGSIVEDTEKTIVDESSFFPLPMYGLSDLILEEGLKEANEGVIEVSVNLERALAKMQFTDKITGGSIENITMSHYLRGGQIVPDDGEIIEKETWDEATGTNLLFIKKEITDSKEGKYIYYMYVPEMQLKGVRQAADLEIMIDLSNGTTTRLFLSPYNSDGSVRDDGTKTKRYDWVRRNTYHDYVVTGDISEEPDMDIKNTIRVCWYHMDAGRFANYYLDLLPGNATDRTKSIEGIKNRFNDGVDNDDYVYYTEIELDGREYTDLMYTFVEEEDDYDSYTTSYFPLLRNLSKDVVKLENRGEVTYCWLTDVPLMYEQPYKINKFPADVPIRAYWTKEMVEDKGYRIPFTVRATCLGYSGGEINMVDGSEVKYDEKRGFYYIDLIPAGDVEIIKIVNAAYPSKSHEVYTRDVFRDKIAGKDYVLFYVE